MAAEITLVNWKTKYHLDQFIAPEEITCKMCKDTKPKSSFVKHASYKIGYRDVCKACERELEKKRKEAKQVDTNKYFSW